MKLHKEKNDSDTSQVLLDRNQKPVPPVPGDDWNLAVRALNEVLTSNVFSSKWLWALGTSMLFGPLATFKKTRELFK